MNDPRPSALVLSERALAQLREAAAAAYPQEACGLLIGSMGPRGVSVAYAEQCANVSPSPLRAFEIEPGAIVAAEDRARLPRPESIGPGSIAHELIGVWHTHPDAPPELSSADRAAAQPGWVSLIGAVRGGALGSLRAWRHDQHGARAVPVVGPVVGLALDASLR